MSSTAQRLPYLAYAVPAMPMAVADNAAWVDFQQDTAIFALAAIDEDLLLRRTGVVGMLQMVADLTWNWTGRSWNV